MLAWVSSICMSMKVSAARPIRVLSNSADPIPRSSAAEELDAVPSHGRALEELFAVVAVGREPLICGSFVYSNLCSCAAKLAAREQKTKNALKNLALNTMHPEQNRKFP